MHIHGKIPTEFVEHVAEDLPHVVDLRGHGRVGAPAQVQPHPPVSYQAAGQRHLQKQTH